MGDGVDNPYLVLGVERTADERAVKKAYVALIRKFTPESAPEEFAKIRAAYELLSDTSARARYDASEKGYAEYGEDVSQKLKEIDEALSARKEGLALEMLEYLAKENPDVAVVQEKLGFLHLQADRAEPALAIFKALAAKEPENARHHLHRAMALAKLGKTPEVEAALQKAHQLAPEDTGISLNLVNYFIAHDRTTPALAIIREVLATLEPKSPSLYVLLLRRIEAHAFADDGLVDEAISELAAKVGESDDPELRPFASSQIASVAAKLFARKKPRLANALLARCRELHPESLVDHPFPLKVSAPPTDLPPAFQEWLKEVGARPSAVTVRQNTWLVPGLAFLAAGGLLVWTATVAVHATPTLGASQILQAWLLLSVSAVALALAVLHVLEILASPFRSFTTLHPLYIVTVQPWKVTLHSLMHLADIRGVHQHTNGVYTGTSITLVIGEQGVRGQFTNVILRVRGKELAQRFLDALIAVRGRSLELMMEGALEAEQLVDKMPPAKLAGLRAGAPRFGRNVRVAVAAGLALGMILTPVAALRSLHDGDDEAFGRAAAEGTREAYREYLALLPHGRHEARARAAAAREVDGSIARLRENGDATSAGAVALVRAVERLREVDGRLGVRVTLEGPAAYTADAAPFVAHVVRVLAGAGLSGMMDAPNLPPAPRPGVVVALRCTSDACAVTVRVEDERATALFEGHDDARARVAVRVRGGADVQVRIERALAAEVLRDAMRAVPALLGIARSAPEIAHAAEGNPYAP